MKLASAPETESWGQSRRHSNADHRSRKPPGYRLENGNQSMTLGTLKLIAETFVVCVLDLIVEL
jgi:hypothetical protein